MSRIHTLINALEVSISSENGRHGRNCGSRVMLTTNCMHPTVKKPSVLIESNGWGNGVGSTGAVDGIVGIPEAATGVPEDDDEAATEEAVPDADVEEAEEMDRPDGNVMVPAAVETTSEAAASCRRTWAGCVPQPARSDHARYGSGEAEESRSSTRGWVV